MAFWRGRDLDCKQRISYQGRSGELSGMTIGDVQIGKLSTRSELIREAEEALKLFDMYLHNLCLTIRSLEDKRVREQEKLNYLREQQKFSRIVGSIIALGMKPDSVQLQEALIKLLSDLGPVVEETKGVQWRQLMSEDRIEEIKADEPEAFQSKFGKGSDVKIEVSVDRQNYRTGDEITIRGKIQTKNSDQPVLIQVYAPSGKAYRFDQTKLDEDGSFEYKLRIGGELGISGIYITKVTYSGVSATTEFRFTVDPERIEEWRSLSIKIGDSRKELRYTIDGASVNGGTGDSKSATLTLQISANVAGKLILEIPRTLFDSIDSEGADLDFIVFVDEIEAFSQDARSSNNRILEITFEKGSKQVDIVGTRMAD